MATAQRPKAMTFYRYSPARDQNGTVFFQEHIYRGRPAKNGGFVTGEPLDEEEVRIVAVEEGWCDEVVAAECPLLHRGGDNTPVERVPDRIVPTRVRPEPPDMDDDAFGGD